MKMALCATVAVAGLATAAQADLLAWWSFNNTANDNDLLNANGDGGSSPSNQFRHMIDNNDPFDDGFYDDQNGRLFPVADTFNAPGGNPGALVAPAGYDPGVGVPNAANYGAYIDVSGLAGDNFTSGTNDNWGSFGGTSANMPGGSFAGGSLSVTGSGNNNRSFSIVADLSGWQNISVSWAQRGTSTGYSTREVEVSTDGVNFTSIYAEAGVLGSSWIVETAAAGNLLDGASMAIIRFTLNGASSTNGNNRFDNIVLEGTVIPAPASLALAGLGGLVAARRRRA